MKYINALTIAGTDPIGGAGIQADLKTFAALEVYGCSVITALVAQNTIGVQHIYGIPAEFVAKQLESIFNDIRIDTIKIGMLLEENIIEVISTLLNQYPVNFIVLDTVMLSKNNDALLSKSAVKILQQKLFPKVGIITPNLLEAAILLGTTCAKNEDDMIVQGKKLISLGCDTVLLKGGHLNSTESPDFLFSSEGIERFTMTRIATKNTHGTGCTLSAAIAALRPSSKNWSDAINKSKIWLTKTLKHADSLKLGKGIGPVHHFYRWW